MKALTILSLLFSSLLLLAQNNGNISYQMVINDAQGLPVSSEVTVRLSIHKGPDAYSTTEVYYELIETTPTDQGLISFSIGNKPGWSSIDWSDGTFFIKTQTDLNNDSSYEFEDINELLTVPYALHANSTDKLTSVTITENQISDLKDYLLNESDPAYNAWDKDFNDLTNLPHNGDLLITESDPTFTQWDKDYNSLTNKPQTDNLITEENDPAFKAWNKDYNSLSNQPSTSGLISSESDPKFNAWDKNYENISNKPELANYATKDMTNYNISNLAMPIDDNDMATKEYVNTLIKIFCQLATPAQLIDAGITPEQLVEAGISIEEIFETGVIFIPNGLTDIDRNQYNICRIADQIWMAENLRVTSYADGTPLHVLEDGNNNHSLNEEWAALEDANNLGIHQTYSWLNDDNSNAKNNGAYYTYASATRGNLTNEIVQGICPDGWHLPNNSELETLKSFLATEGYPDAAAIPLKATRGWPIGEGVDKYNFTATPTGVRDGHTGTFSVIGSEATWWYNYIPNGINGPYFSLKVGSNRIITDYELSSSGLNVRCIKD